MRLGADTTAHPRGTLLGQRVLTRNPTAGHVKPADVIPGDPNQRPVFADRFARDPTANTADTDTAQLNQLLNTLSDTIDRSPQLGADVPDGVSWLSRKRAQRIPGQPAPERIECDQHPGERSQQVNSLLLNANDLIGCSRSAATPS